MNSAYSLRPYSDVYRKRPVQISWKVPLFMNNDWIALKILKNCRRLGVHRPFDIVYGAPLCSWAGGRPSAIRLKLTEAQIEEYFRAYDEYGVTVALTFSRLDIPQKELGDPYCNKIIEIAERHHAQAIIANDALLNHVKREYPLITTIASLDKVMCELKEDFSAEMEYYRRLFESFDEVVVRCECALDNSRITQLRDVANRVEIIVNQVCMPDCKFCYEHISSMEALNDSDYRGGAPHACFYERDAKDYATWLKRNLMIPESRIEELASMEFTKMKLAGRNAPQQKALDTLERYIFEPTGVFWNMKNVLAREYREACIRAQCQLPPFALPAMND